MNNTGKRLIRLSIIIAGLTLAGIQSVSASEVETDTEQMTVCESETVNNEPENNYGLIFENRVPQGVVVNNIDLGGMTIDDAETTLEQLADDVKKGNIELVLEEQITEIPFGDIQLKVVDDGIIESICEIGKKGNLIKRYKELADVKNNKASFMLPFEFNEKKLNQVLKDYAKEMNREPKNAVLVRHSGEFQITDDVTGISVNTGATKKMIQEALGETWDGSHVKLKVKYKKTEADHRSEDLKNVQDRMGSYSTDYSSSSSNRIANIANGASLIDETVVYPGEEFSFLEHVVPFTAANGYYQATGYSGGKVVPSTGGGICQVSSTLYNAVLRAELEVTERYNHGLTVGYVPLGADATVSEGAVDFKFRNNYDNPIYIEAYTWDGCVYTNIYGAETRPADRSIEFYSVTEETIAPGADVITEDASLDEGYKEVTQSAHQGYVASFYKYVYINGTLQDKIKINTSTYSSAPRYVTVGTKKKSKEKDETVAAEGDSQEEADYSDTQKNEN